MGTLAIGKTPAAFGVDRPSALRAPLEIRSRRTVGQAIWHSGGPGALVMQGMVD